MNRAERRAKGITQPPKVDKVVIGYVHPGEVSESFMHSVDRLKRYELIRTNAYVGTLGRIAGSGGIAHGRNLVTKIFLEDETAEWLWFIDADMGFPEWSLQRLLGAADKKERPIVGALTFGLAQIRWDETTNADIYEAFPVFGTWNRNDKGEIVGYRYFEEYPDDNAVLPVDVTGAACVLIHRSVLEVIGSNWWSHIPTPAEGIEGLNGRSMFGEDISFFIRVAEHGFPVWLDTFVKTSHHKGGIYLTHELYVQQEARKRAVAALVEAS